ncbi:hypothetical_protein [Candidozyma auris]|uniref:hypothetical_protein n=1 Tax=Candidozyma auris TaxID=498019 RepID=UPI000D27AAB8|nr:hypothetical_protein [[Candida] auris]QEO21616.1 hypothetical_protein [[Candida] auris]GBL47882.1 hypothetical protein CAJCM15448_01560 [[Candida] auris]
MGPKKIKFSEDGELPDGMSAVIEPAVEKQSSDESESESESDSDEAPEEESISASKARTLKQQKEQEQLEQELKKKEKQKRKEQDLLYQQQQQEKKKKLEEILASSELPDLLPDELIESVEEERKKEKQLPQGKHLRSEELESELAEMRKKAKLEKLKQLKQQRTSAVKKGPVNVQVQTFGEKKKTVPKADPKVLESKNSWLNRESLKRK